MNRFPLAALLACCLASCASSGAQIAAPFPSSKFGRVLIVSGGPDAKTNQYAIESNARYVAAFTKGAKWRRILFADGRAASKTISTVVDTPRTRARAVASWVWDLDAPRDVVQLRAPTLNPISGASTPDAIAHGLAAFGAAGSDSAPQLVYFTGHGGPGTDDIGRDDFGNTLYAAWGDDFSTRRLARALQAAPAKAPLVLVMVQCHAGGFANTLFVGGDPAKPVWNRDFCGFFAAIAERPAAGCTSQVNERDYQDFTTHFFAALSGTSRDGRRVTGADFNRDGHVSLDEALAYAQIHDDSIDVPLATSDAFLRRIFPAEADARWLRTSFDRLLQDASPSQRAVLLALDDKLVLEGDTPLLAAQSRYDALQVKTKDVSADATAPSVGIPGASASYDRLEKLLQARHPNFKTLRGAARARALNDATTLLAARPDDLNRVYRAYLRLMNDDAHDIEEARVLRFLREGRTVLLSKRLEKLGTPAQKAVFARLKASEARWTF